MVGPAQEDAKTLTGDCCAGCFVLHPASEFPKSQLGLNADRRTCLFGPLVGVVDFCPCFRMTIRPKAKLVKHMLHDQKTGRPIPNVLEGHKKSSVVHECYAERWSDDDPDRARQWISDPRLDVPLYDTIPLRKRAERCEKNFNHGSAFARPELGPVPTHWSRLGEPDGWCYACDCEDGQRIDRQFRAIYPSSLRLISSRTGTRMKTMITTGRRYWANSSTNRYLSAHIGPSIN
jgi:hypothetical protein